MFNFIFILLFIFPTLFASHIPGNHRFYVALRQKNINLLHDYIYNISDPYSPNYGKYLNNKQIDNIIGTSSIDKQSVISWLKSYGIKNINEYSDALSCMGTYKDISKAFKVKFNIVHQTNNGITIYTSDIYKIPKKLRNIIDFVEGLYPPRNGQLKNIRVSNVSQVVDPGMVTREVLMRVYNIPKGLVNKNLTSIGPMEYQGQSGFSQKDLMKSQLLNGLVGNPVSKDNIIGKIDPEDVESALDIQFISQTAGNAELYFENFDGWMYTWAVNFYNRKRYPQIVSLSWGWNMNDQCTIDPKICNEMTSKQYVERSDKEFMKLAAKGVTIVVASGDAGSPGRTNEMCDTTGNFPYTNPVFPGSSEWVVSVGATYLVESNNHHKYHTPMCKNFTKCANGRTEQGTNYKFTSWTSGSGFSLWTDTPKWQEKQVNDYLNSGVLFPDHGYWNRKGRAYPDVAALGHNCYTNIYGSFTPVDGTSCAAPIFAAVLALLNNHQLERGKPVLGYVNPLLYKMWEDSPMTFNDVLVGNSSCTEMQCCNHNFGFSATKGWDVVTGLGTPDVGKMMEWLDKNI